MAQKTNSTTASFTIDTSTANVCNSNSTYTTYTTTNTGTTANSTTYLNYNPSTITTSEYWVTTPSTIGWSDYADAAYSNKASIDKNLVQEIIKDYFKDKDKENMNTDFSFGPFNTKDIRLSLYGMAVKNKSGKWVSYDKKTCRLMDVEVFNIDIDSTKVFYKLPKAVNMVAAGDVILHNGKPMFIEEVLDNGKFAVIDPYEGTAITILAPVSPFGFNFITQIVSLADCMPMASEDNPFGNLLPFMLGSGDNSGLLMAMMMNKDMDEIDPMMLAMMNGNNNLLSLLLIKMMNKKNKPTK